MTRHHIRAGGHLVDFAPGGLVNATNQPPLAGDDTATTTSGIAVTIDVAANDSDPDGTIVRLDLDDLPKHGALHVDAAGTITYTSERKYDGADAFSYVVTDNDGATAIATVSVDVGLGKPPPNGSFTGHDDYVDLRKNLDQIGGSTRNGDDILFATKFADGVYGARGDDFIAGRSGNDGIDGLDGNDIVRGGRGDDSLEGEQGNDVVHGDHGDDSLLGDNGDDLLFGGAGNDTMVGGRGADRFRFTAADGSGTDFINDFDDGRDLIMLRDTVVTGISNERGSGPVPAALIHLDDGTNIIARGVRAGQLSDDDFILLQS